MIEYSQYMVQVAQDRGIRPFLDKWSDPFSPQEWDSIRHEAYEYAVKHPSVSAHEAFSAVVSPRLKN